MASSSVPSAIYAWLDEHGIDRDPGPGWSCGFDSRHPLVTRQQRLIFGEVAELYDRARPSYPLALVDHLVALAEEAAGAPSRPGQALVLDAGCGTGKAAVLLAARGLAGMGVEPDPAMAAVARRNLSPFAQWSVEGIEFETLAPSFGPFDLITCGQAWHWLDAAARYPQAARLLRPRGWLALFWNRPAADGSALRRAIDEVYAEAVHMVASTGGLTAGQPEAGEPSPEDGFEEIGWQVFPWVARYTTAQMQALVQTHSDVRMLAPARRQDLLERLAEVLDAAGGGLDHPYDCWLWTGRREGGRSTT